MMNESVVVSKEWRNRMKRIVANIMQNSRLVRAIRRKRERIGMRNYLLSIADE